MTRTPQDIDRKIAQEALAIERSEAYEVGQIAYMTKILVQCTLPHRDPGDQIYQRTNGAYRLTILSPPEIGIPWGRYPRLLLPFITTEALRTRSRRITLGRSLSRFMHDVGVSPCGGSEGPIARFRDQAVRLFSSTIITHYADSNEIRTQRFDVARELRLWRPNGSQQIALWGSYVELTSDFYQSILEHPVPLDNRVLRVLRAPLAIDLYAWLTFRSSYLRTTTTIAWPFLAVQFGSDYSHVKHFKAEAVKQLRRIVKLYPDLRVQPRLRGLVLHPSPTHIQRRI